eukprot:Gregarina_sp_Poly_1__486@NODE_1118_length_5031_cov_23_233481_g775_i0_p1_GENE_NODE_1118_length_5031_cov_23_233481_g775_i0NODE_1118_length_5031_cov_23_233481_g775_i0_p1_ORF_typecomplete_len421_score54_43Ank_5/PF13857_6/9_1e02Ank_5/PF13857_6/0_00037Ank_5/PF13857_6/1e12Ank_5/PF13857_6/1_1e11Ank_5/PF13857_6/0_003Ank_5/PF13857_6/0_0014Ank_5/PF13857_6/6_9e11Ank_5/PF13857_6/2_4e11Ank_5/PF13857_6/2_7e09Ank_2/PF12796_7/0_00015Ank_2/PF12796_7/4_5e13Ank_2/PF12796_7/4_4e13Ank_2/PF12796_7/2e05Ank_2/PF12796_7/
MEDRKSALFAALHSRNPEALETLLGSMTPEEISTLRNRRNRTLLIAATGLQNRGAVAALINAGADVSATGAQDKTSLMLAAGQGDSRAAQMLLNAGANVDATDCHGNTALMYAIQAYSVEIIRLLLQKSPKLVNVCNRDGLYPLLYTVKRDRNCETHFGVISIREPIAIVIAQLLIDAGAHIDATSNTGKTALMFSVTCPALVRMLVAAGATLNISDNLGLTALAHAVTKARLESVQILMDAGANPNTATAVGKTPLMQALALNHLDIAKILCSRSANLDTPDDLGQTALIQEIDRLKVVAGRDENHYPDISQLVWLLESGAAVNMRTLLGETALMRAASGICGRNMAPIFLLLFDYGADPRIRDLQGYTVLSRAVEGLNENSWAGSCWCVSELVRYLLPRDPITFHKSRLLMVTNSVTG